MWGVEMREILFKGKDKSSGAWVYGSYVHYAKRGVAEHCILSEGKQMLSIIPDTVGQYTGLDDKKGVKIFEGDIVRYTDEYSCVKTVPVVWGGKYHPAFDLAVELYNCVNSLVELLLDSDAMSDAMVEVIGNIYDNPELLEESKNE